MQITVDGVDLYELSAIDIEILEYVFPASTLDADCKRRLEWVLRLKIKQAYKRLRKDWMPILETDPAVTQVPINDEAFFNMVKVRPDYMDWEARDAAQE